MAKEAKKVRVYLYSAGLRAQYGAGSSKDAVEVPSDVAEHVVATGCGALAKGKKKAERATNAPE